MVAYTKHIQCFIIAVYYLKVDLRYREAVLIEQCTGHFS